MQILILCRPLGQEADVPLAGDLEKVVPVGRKYTLYGEVLRWETLTLPTSLDGTCRWMIGWPDIIGASPYVGAIQQVGANVNASYSFICQRADGPDEHQRFEVADNLPALVENPRSRWS